MSKVIKSLTDLNAKAAAQFSANETQLEAYLSEHPTAIAALLCMDGRVLSVPAVTGTPVGAIAQFHNIGGKFDLGWLFGAHLHGWHEETSDEDDHVVLSTYHFSASPDSHLGCAGHGYDTAAAIACATGLKDGIEQMFAAEGVRSVVVGIETDNEAYVWHGANGSVLNGANPELHGLSSQELRDKLAALYSDLSSDIVDDLLPLFEGNVRHVAALQASGAAKELNHAEDTLILGDGSDWLQQLNKALIVQPYSRNLEFPVAVAGKVLHGNLKAGRIPAEDGIAIVAQSAYTEDGADYERAVREAHSLAAFAHEVFSKEHPELLPQVRMLVGVVNMQTLALTQLDWQPATAKVTA